MSFSYSGALTTDKDRVRFHSRDNDPTQPLLSDEEIAGLLSIHGVWQKVVAEAFRLRAGMVGINGRNYSNVEGTISELDAVDALRALAADWDRQAAAVAATNNELPRAVIRTLGGSPSDRYTTRV